MTENRQEQEIKQDKKRCFLVRMIFFTIKFSIVGLVVCLLISAYYYFQVLGSSLDAEEKWATPAIVYSRPLELTVDQNISFTQLEHELSLLKYRKVKDPSHPGEYGVSRDKSKIVLIRRSFEFADGKEEARPLLISFSNKRISRIQDADSKADLDYVLMDPVLLDRITSEEGEEDRIIISLADVPQKLIDTLIYVEDREFYNHHGVNPLAIMRAMVVNIKAGKRVQGGSTITQQLVKNYFLTREKSFDRKIRELFMSLVVDARYSKEQILEMYLNEIYLGHGASDIYGFGLASYFYFGVPVNELTWDQVALMVGMIKGPSFYDPRRNPERALARRNLILGLMVDAGKITEDEYNFYSKKPLGVIGRKSFGTIKVPGYIGLLKEELAKELGKNYLKNASLVIYTSLDPQVQLAANKAVTTVIPTLIKRYKEKNLQAAVVVSNWRTSEVLAVVCSSDPTFPGLNRVTKAKRQIGSLVKPAAYLTAFDNGWHLGSMVNDAPLKVKLVDANQTWEPKNFDHKYLGWKHLYEFFAQSRNIPMVRVGLDYGADRLADTLYRLGYHGNITPVPSIFLGSVSMTPYEVNQMYATIATEGLYKPLSAIRSVKSGDEVIFNRAGKLDAKQVIDPRNAYLTIYGMTVVTNQGTARSLRANKVVGRNTVLAGKTGTSNESRDAWFSGFDNNELVTVWLGKDDNTPTRLTGSNGPLKIYDSYITERGVKSLQIARPEGIEFVNFNKEGYIMDSETCTNVGDYVRLPVRSDKITSDQRRICKNIFEETFDKTTDFFKSLFD